VNEFASLSVTCRFRVQRKYSGVVNLMIRECFRSERIFFFLIIMWWEEDGGDGRGGADVIDEGEGVGVDKMINVYENYETWGVEDNETQCLKEKISS
jgi:hypothetical protein